MLVVNAKVVPDVFVYRAKDDVFSVWNLVNKDLAEMAIKRAEVDAWIGKIDIPLPKWVQNGRR